MIKFWFTAIFYLSFVLISESAEISDSFFKALGQVESNQNPKAYNKTENAIGIFQIRKLYFIDAQNFAPELRKYKHEDCFDEEISRKIVLVYLSKYCKNFTWKEMANCHNGRLFYYKKTGQAKKNLDSYWTKFSVIMLKLD